MIRTLSILCLLGLVMASTPIASAEDLKADINIRIIYAVKTKAKSLDPALSDIKAELQALPFDKFRLLDKLQTIVPINSTVELQFPGDRAISVRFMGLDVSGDKDMLSLQLSVKPRLNMRLRIADGGRTLLGGPSHQDGILFLDISAKLTDAEKSSSLVKPAGGDSLQVKKNQPVKNNK